MTHGTLNGYVKKCRCEECRTAWSDYQRAWKAARLADTSAPHDRVKYVSGCRCSTCRAANAAYNLRRKASLAKANTPHGTVDGYGSYRCRCEPCVTAKQAATRDHYVRNQLQFLERSERRRGQKAKDRRTVTPADIGRLFRRFDGRCAYCHEAAEHMEIDHVVPLSRGGRHAIGNLLPACRACNRRKHARLLVEWRYGR